MSSPDPQVRAARNQSTTSRRRAGPSSRSPAPRPASARCSPSGSPPPTRSSRSSPSTSGAASVAEAQWHILDVRDPAIAEKLRGADVVVHLALDLDLETDAAARTAYNVRGTQTVLTAAAAAGVHRVVLCTSAMVYGALPDNDCRSPRTPSCGPRPRPPASATCWRSSGSPAARPRAHPGLNVTVVRPAVLVGGTDTALTRYFESPRLLVVAGSRPAWQFCHVEDLCSALEYAVLEKVEGELAVGLRRLAGAGGGRGAQRDPAHGAALRGRPGRGGPAAPDRPDPVPGRRPRVHDVPLGGQRQPAARRGWRPQWTNEEVLAELLEEVAGPAHGRRPAAGPQGRHGRRGRGRDGGPARARRPLVRRARKARRRI